MRDIKNEGRFSPSLFLSVSLPDFSPLDSRAGAQTMSAGQPAVIPSPLRSVQL